MSKRTTVTRRRFMRDMAAIGATITFLPRGLRAANLNGKINLATVGIGGMGADDRAELVKHPAINIVALCDVNRNVLNQVGSEFPNAQKFEDFRQMFDKMGDKIDAVHIATPDHMHAPIAMMAIMAGKHVYCQKPLTHEVDEARKLTLAARQKGVVTQMGIQIHSTSFYRNAVAIIQSGAIGKVKEVHSWSNKTWGYEGDLPTNTTQPPAHLNWDAWVGVAPMRPYAPGHYAEGGNWRKWYDFGAGTMGDMGIHILDPVAAALELTSPRTIISHSPPPFKHSFGIRNRVSYTFPTTKYTVDDVKVTWYDGGYMPDTEGWPLPEGRRIPDQGSMFFGEKGALLLPHIAAPLLLPVADFRGYNKYERQPNGNHWHLWVDAIRGEAKATANFDYAGPLTETLLLGVLSCRFPGQELKWDAKAMKFTNFSDANALLKRPYRNGWKIPGLG